MSYVSFYNGSGESIPAYGVMMVTSHRSVGGKSVPSVEKPGPEQANAGYLLNGPASVPSGKVGKGLAPVAAGWALYDTLDTPVPGEEWGPIADSWELGSDGEGFKVIGGHASGRVLVRSVGSGGGLGSLAVFSIDSYTEEDQYGAPGFATCTPRYLMCGGTVPGKDGSGKIVVYDPMGCMFNEDAADLEDRWGYAAWMKPTDEEAVRIGEIDSGGNYEADCRWVCLGLCCPDSVAPHLVGGGTTDTPVGPPPEKPPP